MARKEITIDDIKSIELNILKCIDEYCANNKLRYFLLGGTLLGAVRHKGFIPWDDDIDIGMPREDYDKFCKSFSSDSFSLNLPGDKNYPYPFAKVSQKNTVIYELDNTYQGNFGVYVDIFPLNDIPDDLEQRKKYFKKIKRYRSIINGKTARLSKKRAFHKTLILFVVKCLLIFVKVERMTLKIDKYVSSFKDCSHMGNSSWGYELKETTDKSVFTKSREIEFENSLFQAPVNYDEWLTNVFGNYMQLPPVNQRVSNHNFKAYIEED